jgi:SAM-dependent methyltransferase
VAGDELESARERGWRELSAIDAAYRRGELDAEGWHAAVLALVEPVYLAADTDELGSGHHGTPEEWRETRGLIMAAVDRAGSFLDVGCANGLLMASVQAWGGERGLAIEPYGVEISSRLAELARQRYPRWADRIWAANANGWRPPRTFDVVRTGLEYVPANRQPAYVAHLLGHVVAPGGRLVVGKSNERVGDPSHADLLRDWGFTVAGELRVPHEHRGLVRTVVWLDRLTPRRSAT